MDVYEPPVLVEVGAEEESRTLCEAERAAPAVDEEWQREVVSVTEIE
jgi:hypothetical protein